MLASIVFILHIFPSLGRAIQNEHTASQRGSQSQTFKAQLQQTQLYTYTYTQRVRKRKKIEEIDEKDMPFFLVALPHRSSRTMAKKSAEKRIKGKGKKDCINVVATNATLTIASPTLPTFQVSFETTLLFSAAFCNGSGGDSGSPVKLA